MKRQNENTKIKSLATTLYHKRMQLYSRIQSYMQSRLMRYFVFACIIGSVLSVILGSFSELSAYHRQMYIVTYATSLIFFIEYAVRFYAAPASSPGKSITRARLHYIFSFYGAVDFVSILPFVFTYKYWNTEMMHLIILPYVFTVFKMIRYSKSMQLIGFAIKAIRAELVTAFTACGIMICFSAILMYYLEREAQPQVFENIGDSFWWAVVTFTTVGYGDIYPVTALGRLLSSFISLIGIAMIAIPTGIISSAFINVMHEQQKEDNRKKNGCEDNTDKKETDQ